MVEIDWRLGLYGSLERVTLVSSSWLGRDTKHSRKTSHDHRLWGHMRQGCGFGNAILFQSTGHCDSIPFVRLVNRLRSGEYY